jgi:DNA-directed RNA polymerase subunit beta'
MYTMGGYDADAAAFDYSPFGSGSGQAVPLEDFDYGPFRT